jgi:hypothetical protein
MPFDSESFGFHLVPKRHKDSNIGVVLYGCETWSLTLKEERRVSVFENRVCEENIWA